LTGAGLQEAFLQAQEGWVVEQEVKKSRKK
jgi:hypothetical protein